MFACVRKYNFCGIKDFFIIACSIYVQVTLFLLLIVIVDSIDNNLLSYLKIRKVITIKLLSLNTLWCGVYSWWLGYCKIRFHIQAELLRAFNGAYGVLNVLELPCGCSFHCTELQCKYLITMNNFNSKQFLGYILKKTVFHCLLHMF